MSVSLLCQLLELLKKRRIGLQLVTFLDFRNVYHLS